MTADVAHLQAAAHCRTTRATDPPFVPPTPYPSTAPQGHFWFGSDQFWTLLPSEGAWDGLPHNELGLRQKIFWWRPGFDGRLEPVPALTVTGRRLDGPGTYVHRAPATNASHPDFGGWAMLTGVDIPDAGCWELTGRYRGQALTFVIWIT
jgi:hypothetical protein